MSDHNHEDNEDGASSALLASHFRGVPPPTPSSEVGSTSYNQEVYLPKPSSRDMPKRANPFMEDLIPQSKVHVGIKQFNNNDDRLRKVYEKTLDLLFKGAKKVVTSDAHNNNTQINVIKKDEKMKQLFIGKNGVLSHSGSYVKSPVSSIRQCVCGAELECGCAYCEVVLCAACQHSCARCHRTYCVHCIVLGSEGSEVCVSCYC